MTAQHPLDLTHDPDLRCWLDSARDEASDFPVQNLPFGVFSGGGNRPRIGVAIGDRILDLSASADLGLLEDLDPRIVRCARAESLNLLMSLERERWTELRLALSGLLTREADRQRVEPCLVAMSEASLQMPARVGDYTDFYASLHHATNVGRLFRPDNPLLPNYKHMPIGYHGRASSLVVSGTEVRRPLGQRKPPEAEAPVFGPCQLLDYELEVGFFAGGPANRLGQSVPLADAEDRIFGLILVNDWSARDLQAWEYQPLGPFLAKSFATSVSPWVVTLDALAPFRSAVPERPDGDPQPLPYLRHAAAESPGFDLVLEVLIESAAMRERGVPPHGLSRGSFRDMYWTLAQMLAHHTSNGCNLRPGDLMASGTVSGAEDGTHGSMLEITGRGARPLTLPGDEQRAMLEDGDEVILRGWCERDGFRRIGFGECRGRILPAHTN